MEPSRIYALLETRNLYDTYRPVKPLNENMTETQYARFRRLLAEKRHTFFMKVKACYVGRPCSAEDDVMWMESADELDEYYRNLWAAGKWCGLPESNWKSPTT